MGGWRCPLPSSSRAVTFIEPAGVGQLLNGGLHHVEIECPAFPVARDTGFPGFFIFRSEEHTSELQSLMRISYAAFCSKKKTNILTTHAVIVLETFTVT